MDTAKRANRKISNFAVWLGLLLPGWLGCADTDLTPPPDVVFAAFDPAAAMPIIPLPNDLTMMPAPTTTPAFAQLSGPLDPASIRPDTVIVLDATAMRPILGATAQLDPTSNRLVIAPPASGWPLGHRIAIALRGRPAMPALTGKAGQPVVASPAFFFARSVRPISNCALPAPDCTSTNPMLIPVAQAVPLERLRQALAPLFLGLEAAGIPRDQVALAWTFTVSP